MQLDLFAPGYSQLTRLEQVALVRCSTEASRAWWLASSRRRTRPVRW